MTWVERLSRLCHITALSQELVRFDTQLMQNAEIAGVAYQQGELAGYEVREYLLEKWNRTCAYCGEKDVPLEVEHIIPTARGGSDRVSNLTLACVPCNQKKGTQTATEFGFPQIQAQARLPLKDAAAVNATRWALYHQLCATGLPVEVGTGGRTNTIARALASPSRTGAMPRVSGPVRQRDSPLPQGSRSVFAPWAMGRGRCVAPMPTAFRTGIAHAKSATSGCRRAIWSRRLSRVARMLAPGQAASASGLVAGLTWSSRAEGQRASQVLHAALVGGWLCVHPACCRRRRCFLPQKKVSNP